MDIMEKIYEQAASNPQRVAFSECTEEKILKAARECADRKLIIPVLVGDIAAIKEAAASFGIAIDDMEMYDTTDEDAVAALIDEYLAKNEAMLSAKGLKRRSADPMYPALMLLANGKVNASFAGLTHTTGDVIQSGSIIVGLKEGIITPSSIGIAKIPGWEGSEGDLLAFGDSAVCVNPASDELASIAISACETCKNLLGWDPRCALLSYSTDGSADSELTQKVKEAVRIANETRPDFKIDGEFQFDSAVKPDVAAKKVKRESAVAGKANIVIWPDLNCGNVGVKLIQTFGKADAYGPLLQGFRKVVCDCSRGAPVSEMVGNIAMAAVRAQNEG
ncbi:MAG: phosphate acetyltransferase [Oscillospiraceae bacterium]|nr:phosphate acetyltransferase [Oscillospiraceae bacterium]